MKRHAIYQISHADGVEWVDYSRLDYESASQDQINLWVFGYILKEAASLAAENLENTCILRARVEDWNEEGADYRAPAYYISPFRDPGDSMIQRGQLLTLKG